MSSWPTHSAQTAQQPRTSTSRHCQSIGFILLSCLPTRVNHLFSSYSFCIQHHVYPHFVPFYLNLFLPKLSISKLEGLQMFPPLENLFSHSKAISFSLANAFQFTVTPDMTALYFYISLSLLYCELLEEERESCLLFITHDALYRASERSTRSSTTWTKEPHFSSHLLPEFMLF